MKKICFIPPLQDKTVKKTKTQTRRIMTIQPANNNMMAYICYNGDKYVGWRFITPPTSVVNIESKLFKPRYNVGEIVAIAQPYKDIFDTLPEPYRRKSDGWISTDLMESIGCRNKLYVKPELMPYRIKITDVRAERLQKISDEDCAKEGVEYLNGGYINGFSFHKDKNGGLIVYDTPQESYAALIDKINGKGTWDSNPFVWVYDYKLIIK